MRRLVPAILCLLAIVVPAHAQRPKLTLGYDALAPSKADFWVGKDAGIFERHGLDVELTYIAGGSRAIQALLAGGIRILSGGGPPALHSILGGSDIVLIAGPGNTFPYLFLTAREITRPEQLRGKALGISQFGTSSDFATRYVIERLGLKPQEVTLLQVGSVPARLAALQSGTIQGTLLLPPVTAVARKLGLNVLADMTTLDLPFQQTCIVTTRAFIRDHRATVQTFMRAYLEAIHHLKTRRPESIAIIARYMKMTDQEALEESYDFFAGKIVPRKPYPTLPGIQLVLKEIALTNPKARDFAPERAVDFSFIRELDESGFLDRLWAR
jgi:NitT/TauT family transport system substrate-binding protein